MTLFEYSCKYLKCFRYQNNVCVTFSPQIVTVYHNIFTDGLHTKFQIPDVHPLCIYHVELLLHSLQNSLILMSRP